MTVEQFIHRLNERLDIWDELASLSSAPNSFNDLYRICASEIRDEILTFTRKTDTWPAPKPGPTTPAPSAE